MLDNRVKLVRIGELLERGRVQDKVAIERTLGNSTKYG
jgi:hypothetical protein